MTMLPTQFQGLDRWLVLGAVTLAFFFLNLSTFTSLGVVLFTMVAELHWSMTAAGFSFTLLGLSCGLSSPLPALTMRWLGTRATVGLGALLLLAGFVLAALTQSLATFYLGMVCLGIGYSLAGNVPAISLIAAWFTCGSARTIGLYLMLGALGAAFGPPIVAAMVSGSGGWRGYWQMMAICAGVVGVVCLAFVREARIEPAALPAVCPESCRHDTPECPRRPAVETPAWSVRQAVFTSQFLLVAASMAATMAGVTTASSVLVSHLVRLGSTPAAAAMVLSTIAITATVVKGIGGRLCERFPSTALLAIGVLLQAAGNFAFAFAGSPVLQYASALTFGAGWGLAFVAANVVVLEYFGPVTGSRSLSVVWLLTTVAAAALVPAGAVVDRYGTFSPVFDVYAIAMLALSVPLFLMREPAPRRASMPAAAG